MSGKRPRVLVMGPLPPPYGGVSMVVSRQMASQLAQDYELRLVNVSKPTSRTSYGKLNPSNLFFGVGQLSKFVGELLFHRPKVIHIHTHSGIAFLKGGAFSLLGRMLGIPTLLHMHSGNFAEHYKRSGGAYQRMARFILRRCSTIIAVSPQWAEYYRELAPGANVAVVRQGIECERYQRNGAAADGRMELLFVGFLCKDKGVHDILQAAPDVLRNHPEARFVFVGSEMSSGDRDAIVSLTHELGLENSVDFAGHLPAEKAAEYYQRARVFLLPSYAEGFPVVICEAMSAGLPIVTCPVGGIPDVIRDGENGLLIPPGDSTALSTAISRLLDNPELEARLGAAAQKQALEVFSIQAHVATLDRIYQRCIAGRRESL